jgi:integrase
LGPEGNGLESVAVKLVSDALLLEPSWSRSLAVSTQAAANRAGISRKLTFHDLRRTYGAMLIEAGVDIYTVSRLLGHADVRITQEVYAPLSGRFMAEQAAKLGRHIGRVLSLGGG